MSRDQMRYSRLANITKLINSNLELCEVLKHVTTAISEEIVQCNAVGIYLPQGDGTFRGYVGKPEIINGTTLDKQVIDPKTDLLAREVIETNRTIYIPDTSKDSRPNPVPVEVFQIKSILVLPIAYEKERYGLVFLFDYGKAMNLTKSEIQSVEAYVNMAGAAIRNANFLKQKENLISQKQLLLDVTRDLSQCSSIKGCLNKCFFYIDKVLDKPQIGVKLLKSTYEDNWIETAKTFIHDKFYVKLIQTVIKEKKAVHIPNVFLDKRLNHEIFIENGAKSLYLIPFVSLGEVLGIICIAYEEKDSKDGVAQIQLVQSIVDATAPALSSSMYMSQLEKMIDERTEQLESAIEKNNNVIESIPDGFIALNKEWNYTYINKHYGYQQKKTPEELLGKNIWEVYPEAVGTGYYKKLHKVMKERIPVHLEIRSILSEHWYEIVAYPYDEGICCLIKDITEKKKYEKELKRLSGLQLIGQMAAGISHEIRNPLTTVRGFLQLLNEDENLGKFKQYIDLMVEELDRANSIISEFLSMSNTRTSDLQRMDLNSIIHDMTPLINVDAFSQNKLISIETNEIPELLLNRNEIRQLIMNLYRNGLEAMSEGQVLTIRTCKEDCFVVLSVHDQGKGIKPEVLEKLGTPFFTTKENGTGLGLGVSYAIAARHNAKIEIQTGKEGTIFYVRFSCP